MKPIFWHSLIIAASLLLSPALPPWLAAKAEVQPEIQPEVQANSPETEEKTEETEPTADVVDQESPEVEETEDAAAKAEAERRREILIAADKLYLAGDYVGAKALYQQVKPPFSEKTLPDQVASQPEPIYDPELLPPAGQVYWREGNAGIEQKLATRIFIPLELLVEQYPEFIPGHLLLAQALQDNDRLPQAVEVLERATTLYPQQTDLLRAQIDVLIKSRQWLEASIAARQFALLNSDHPQAAEFKVLAEQNYERFRSYLRKMITGNAIANVITGAATVALTGNPLGALSAVETLMLLAQGESGLGDRIAKNAIENLEIVEDEEIVAYINDLGQKLAQVSGRDDFKYEFHVVLDPNLNAFALPGGKVFVNAGAIYYSESEAELAGLLTHELAHAILSHGFQMVTHGNLVETMTRFVPFGGTIGSLLVLDYSRDMERQADLLGTRMLAAADYAADGLRNLMVTLNQKYGDDSPVLKALSSHPPTKERIAYLEGLITRGGYNRFAYEGVERHQQIRQRVAKLLKEKKADDPEVMKIE